MGRVEGIDFYCCWTNEELAVKTIQMYQILKAADTLASF